jgi:uncharacterized membrane protein
MKIRNSEIILWAIVALSFIAGFCFYPHMPQKMATHWGCGGQVDGYMSRTIGVFLMPLVLTGVVLFFIAIPRIDPLRANIEKFRKHYDGFAILLSIFLLALHLQMLSWNIGIEISPNKTMPIGLGILFFYIGIICENVKRNWFLGIRTPWTLSNEIVWEKTHKIGAKLFKAVGVITFLGFFFSRYAVLFVIIPVLLAALYTIIYSYIEYRKVQKSDIAKEKYLLEVEKTLAAVKHPRSKEVLDDVRSHVDRRFAELGPDKQTPENFQKIIDEMGTPSDYAELLEPDTAVIRRNVRQRYILWTIVAVAIIALMVLSIVFTDKGKSCTLKEAGTTKGLGYPFVDDPEIVGFWESIDFVETIEKFSPSIRTWSGELYLKNIRFMDNGKTSTRFTWTKDWIWHNDGKTKAQYKIKKMNSDTYLFLPWLSGDVTIRGQKPRYYVLKKVSL